MTTIEQSRARTASRKAAYDAAVVADDKFHACVVKQFGARQASEARYGKPSTFNAETKAAYLAKLDADRILSVQP